MKTAPGNLSMKSANLSWRLSLSFFSSILLIARAMSLAISPKSDLSSRSCEKFSGMMAAMKPEILSLLFKLFNRTACPVWSSPERLDLRYSSFGIIKTSSLVKTRVKKGGSRFSLKAVSTFSSFAPSNPELDQSTTFMFSSRITRRDLS